MVQNAFRVCRNRTERSHPIGPDSVGGVEIWRIAGQYQLISSKQTSQPSIQPSAEPIVRIDIQL